MATQRKPPALGGETGGIQNNLQSKYSTTGQQRQVTLAHLAAGQYADREGV